MKVMSVDSRTTLAEPRMLISRAALLHNVASIRDQLRPGVKVCAMVKADAYGHDANIVTDTLCNFTHGMGEAPAVDALGVATIDEAAALPNPTVPVIIFQP